MEIAILIIALIILIETTILVVKKFQPTLSSRRKIYVDTSVLIDGRILEVARSGFLDGDLIILKSVLLELQLLADSKDAEKRTRARAGLDNASELERVINVNTEIIDDTGGLKKVDEQLLKVAKETRGAIMTVDFNLIKVAKAEKIETLNINDLAIAVRTEYLPGEQLKIKIQEKGTGRGQGVGHLPNGVMVVVDNASTKIGKEVNVKVVKFLETSAGRMLFTKII
jgi:uncharacterized protein YacL